MLWTFLRHLDRTRIEPIVVFFQPGSFERDVAALSIRTVVLPAGRLREVFSAVWTVRALRLLLLKERPDVLLNWSPKTQLYGAAAAVLAGMPGRVIWWQHGLTKGHWIDRVASLLPARAVGCSSRAGAEAQHRRRPTRPTFVVHPGIDQPRPLAVSERDILKDRLTIPRDRAVIGIVGRLEPGKGQDRVLRALARLRASGRDVHGLVVGGDAYGLAPGYQPSLHRLAQSIGIGDAVTFTGQVADAGPYLQLMDVMVNATEGEPFGIVLLEAMAAGVPVVAVDAAGPREIIEPGRSGVLIAAGDDSTIAQALDRLLADPSGRRRLAEAGRRRYDAVFRAEQMTLTLQHQLEVARAG
jgi:glycosyltransferase involved in cell wall biosynthesis